MQSGICLYRRRTDVFCRQGLQERAQALQGLQSETGRGRRWWWRTRLANALGNKDKLLAVREGNHSSLPSHTRAAGVLQGMFPATQGNGRGVKQELEVRTRMSEE